MADIKKYNIEEMNTLEDVDFPMNMEIFKIH